MNKVNWNNQADATAFARQALLLANLPREGAQDEPYEYSEQYRRWEQTFLADPFRYAKKKRRAPWERALRSAAAVFLVLAIGFGALMLHPAARAVVMRWFTEVFTTHDAHRFTDRPDAPVLAEGKWYPSYLPEGYVEIEFFHMFGYAKVTFENEADARIYFDYQTMEEGSAFQVDNENRDIIEMTVNGYPAVLYQSQIDSKPHFILWMDEEENIAFKLIAFESCETLIRIAESVVFIPAE